MPLTLAILRPLLVDKLGLLAIDEMIPTASLNNAINAGVQRMASEYAWPWLKSMSTITFVSGTDTYALPAGAIKVLAVGVGERSYAKPVQFEDMVRYATLSGRPQVFTVMGADIKFGPTPSRAGDLATIVYSKTDNVLVSDADVLLTPDHYTDIVLTYAGLYQASRLKDITLQNSLELTRQQWLKTMARDQAFSRGARLRVEEEWQ